MLLSVREQVDSLDLSHHTTRDDQQTVLILCTSGGYINDFTI